MNFLVIGAGKMTTALLTGLSKKKPLKDWGIYSPSGTSAKVLAEKVGAIHVADLKAANFDWILVGCKPQQIKDLGNVLPVHLKKANFVSMLAAISEEEQRKFLGVEKLVRVMPNLPVEYNSGVSLISSTSLKAHLDQLKKFFSSLGTAIVVNEEELDELTLLTGSGPAFFYEFTQRLSENFTSLDQSTREQLARQVLIGSGVAAQMHGCNLSEMINGVTSKGGVTIAVLEKLRALNLSGILKDALSAGKYRAEELKNLLRS